MMVANKALWLALSSWNLVVR
uniref:Uncharacterized protein n=1 Tax=Anguilla anguilla TaxID=7936 RepID=A0A0E9R946_ANGAN